MKKDLIKYIPKEVSHVTQTLEKAGFEAYLVGGCVRDLVMSQILSEVEGGREPKDWDVTTNAKPEQIMALFEKTVYENTFGTVGVVVSRLPAKALASAGETTSPRTPLQSTGEGISSFSGNLEKAGDEVIRETMVIEVTPYRLEAKYSDFRHPDEVKFSDNLSDDLKRRDFTINAMALDSKGQLVDLYEGLKDIESRTLRTVGNPDDRFAEDALRMLRAIRFACQLNFYVSHETAECISKNADLIKEISDERIRDEFVKIIMSENPAGGVVMLSKFGILKHIIPELEEGIGCVQGGEHIYDVWEHLLQALQHAADKKWPLEIRLAALFHDIGKPRSKRSPQPQQNSSRFTRQNGAGSDTAQNFAGAAPKSKPTFYGHEVIGARMVKKIMERLKFPKKEMELVEKLVRNHMFFSDTELITLSAVRRIITKVGVENIWNLMNVRESDRVGMKKKEAPYRLRKYFAMIEEALRDPISVSQLKIDGEYMIKNLGITPGPRMGWILHSLLEEVLDAPEKNTVEHLSELVKSLNMLGDAELRALGERGKEKKEELEEGEIEKLHSKHGVRK